MGGDWWTVYGQSCGQTDQWGEWAGAYDWYPCSHARFLQLDDGNWINNTTYCAGSGSICEETFVTIPKVYWSSPGVLRHDYPQSSHKLKTGSGCGSVKIINGQLLSGVEATLCLSIMVDFCLADQGVMGHCQLIWSQQSGSSCLSME